jgi:hypothetical protein
MPCLNTAYGFLEEAVTGQSEDRSTGKVKIRKPNDRPEKHTREAIIGFLICPFLVYRSSRRR